MLLGGLDRPYAGDEGDYARLAREIIAGDGFLNKDGTPTSFWSPGLPLLVTIPTAILGPGVVGIRIFMCFVESLLIPASYILARSVTNSQKLGFMIATIAVFFPTWAVPSGSVLTDFAGTILVALLITALIQGYRSQSLLWTISAGMLWGLATLVRAESPIYAPAIIFWLLVVMPDWKKRFVAVAAVVISFASVIAPWTIRNTSVHGQFILTSTQGGIELYKANNPNATGILAYDHSYFDAHLEERYPIEQYPNEVSRAKMYQSDALRFIAENPARFLELSCIRFVQFWKLYSPRVPLINSLAVIVSFGFALPFFLIQVVRRGWRPGPEMLLLLIVLSHTAAHVVFTSIVRYRIPIEPLVLVLALQGLSWTLSWFGSVSNGLSRSKLPARALDRTL
jgi:hypothetical protein